jgi:predicted nucleotidyltransferase
MSLRGRLEYDLSRLVKVISRIEEVIGIILFGSYARGDYDEYSDYDILVIFKDKDSMWRRWDDLFKSVGELRLLIHLIPKSYDEFLNSERVFLDELYKQGIVLYAKYPFTTYLKPIHLKCNKIIVYDLSSLKQKEKMKLLYELYGKKEYNKPGLIKRLNGEKLSSGCITIPSENAQEIIKVLKRYNVKIRIIDVYT